MKCGRLLPLLLSLLLSVSLLAPAALAQEVLNSAYGSVLAGLLGEGQAQSLLSTSPNTREELALLERETALVNEYWEAVVQEPSVQSGGRTWTRAQADAAYLVGSLEEDAYLTLVGELAAVRNGVLAPIYLELVKVRNQYAASKGYDDYVQYAYQTVYGRDYTCLLYTSDAADEL